LCHDLSAAVRPGNVLKGIGNGRVTRQRQTSGGARLARLGSVSADGDENSTRLKGMDRLARLHVIIVQCRPHINN